MLYLQIESPKSSVLNFLDSNSFEVIISIFQRTEKVPDMERLRYNQDTWEDVKSACANSSWLTLDRFSQEPNICNSKYYLDTPSRRGYAESYYSCLLKI